MRFFWPIAVLLTAGSAFADGDPPKQLPPDVQVMLTDQGPVFADAKGMTLYYGAVDGSGFGLKAGTKIDGYPNKSACDDKPATLGIREEIYTPFPLADDFQRSTCVTKSPPLLAAADAKPVGAWTLFDRDDGTRQWAYKGRAVYRSIKDKQPGALNGAWAPATAPIGQPPGVKVERHPAGLVFTFQNKPLYAGSAKAGDCSGACLADWLPFESGALALSNDDWSPVARPDGSKQWAYRGKLVYLPAAYDPEDGALGAMRDALKLIVLRPAPQPPGAVTVQESSVGPIYADAQGSTLYVYVCFEPTAKRLSCDDPGDNPLYYNAMCGEASDCAGLYKPLIADADAKAENGTWTIVTVNPKNPILPAASGEGARVWAYLGRPVFRFARSTGPGDLQGGRRVFPRAQWYAVPAYGTNYQNSVALF